MYSTQVKHSYHTTHENIFPIEFTRLMLHEFKIIHIVEEYRHTAGLKENFFPLFPVEG